MTHHEEIQSLLLGFLAGEKAGRDCLAGSSVGVAIFVLVLVVLLA